MFAFVDDDRYTTLAAQNNYSTIGTSIYPRFDVCMDMDQNGVYDEWELPLAEKFCPTLKLHHSTEWLAPEPVEIVSQEMYMRKYNINGQLISDEFYCNTDNFNYSYSPWTESPFRLNAEWYIPHFEYAGLNGNDPSSWIAAYQNERNNNNYSHTIYAHFFKSGSSVILQFWMFYPYNDGWNNHEGDWEHINIHLSSQNPSIASIQKIDFYFHHKVKRLTSGYEAIGTHTVVYVGGSFAGADPGASYEPGNHTGGSYPWSGKWDNVSTWGYDEWVHGNGPTIYYSAFKDGDPNNGRGIVILPEPDKINYTTNPEMSWLSADVAWGHVSVDSPWDWNPFFDVGDDAVCGPYHNPGWNETGAVDGAYDNY